MSEIDLIVHNEPTMRPAEFDMGGPGPRPPLMIPQSDDFASHNAGFARRDFYNSSVLGPRTPPMTPPRLSEAEELARLKADYSRREFYKNRKILIEDVPPVTYEEVKEYMGGYKIANINISRKTRNAYVILKHGEEAEEIVQVLRGKKLLDKEVIVSIKPNETLLCLAHLPFHLTDDDLRKFASQFGIIEKCFLMRNERTGESKGYGLVEYTHNRDHTNTARLKIDGMEVYQCRVHCEFILSHLTAFNDLHSKCLFLNKLPPNFVNEKQLEDVCGHDVQVVFSKIGMKNDQPLGFAIIEFASSDHADRIQARIHGHEIRENRTLSATYCVPGMSGQELYNKALNAVGTGRSAGSDVKALGLIPTPNMPPPFMNRNVNSGNTTNPGIRMGMRPPPPPQVAQGLRNLFNQLQVMQQNMNQLMQGGPRPPGPVQPPQPAMGMGFLGPGPNMLPSMNPMMQQAVTLLVASLQSQQQQQQLMMGLNGLQMLLQQQNNVPQGPNRLPAQALQGNPIMLQTNNFLQALLSQLQRQQQSSPQPQQDQPVINRPNQQNRQQGPNQGQGQTGPNQGQGQPGSNQGQGLPSPNQGQGQPGPNQGFGQPGPNHGPGMPPNNNIRGPGPNSGMMQPPPVPQRPLGPRQNSQPPPQFQQQNLNALNNLQQLFMSLQKGGGPGSPNLMQQQQHQNQPRPNNIPQNQGQAMLQTILSNVTNTIMNLAKQGQNMEGSRDGDHRRVTQDQRGRERERSHSERSFPSHGATSSNRPRHSSMSRIGSDDVADSAVLCNNNTNYGNLDDHGQTRPLQGRSDFRHDGGHKVERREQPPERNPRDGDDSQLVNTLNQDGGNNKGQGDGYPQTFVYPERSSPQEGYGNQQLSTASSQSPVEGQQGLYDPNFYAYNDYNNYMSQLQGPYPSTSASSSSLPSPTNQGGPPSQEWVNPLHQQQTQQLPIGARKPSSAVEHSHASGSSTEASTQGQTGPDGVMQAVQQMMAQAQTLSGGMSQNSSPTSSAGSSTPVNPLKRPSTCLVPEPEPSPEGEYVGQHSQGLGGHYSESYVKRRKLL